MGLRPMKPNPRKATRAKANPRKATPTNPALKAMTRKPTRAPTPPAIAPPIQMLVCWIARPTPTATRAKVDGRELIRPPDRGSWPPVSPLHRAALCALRACAREPRGLDPRAPEGAGEQHRAVF